MGSLWISLISIIGGIISFSNKLLGYLKTQKDINTGKKIQNAEIKEKEAEIAIEQTKIILQPKTKEELEKQLDNGKF